MAVEERGVGSARKKSGALAAVTPLKKKKAPAAGARTRAARGVPVVAAPAEDGAAAAAAAPAPVLAPARVPPAEPPLAAAQQEDLLPLLERNVLRMQGDYVAERIVTGARRASSDADSARARRRFKLLPPFAPSAQCFPARRRATRCSCATAARGSSSTPARAP
jgi:hypothetical protein